MNAQGQLLDDLSVVVLSHNRRQELLPNVESLCKLQQSGGFELFVVDNASTDGTKEELLRLQECYPDLVVILSDANLGPPGGRNLGWSKATRTFILSLDDDTYIEFDGMIALRDAAAASETTGIVTPKVVDAVTGVCQNDWVVKLREPANFAGACFLVRRTVLKHIGELDPDCNFGGEELDYSIRARAAGYSTMSLGEVTVRHHGIVRTGNVGRRRREQWLYNFSRVSFKHFPVKRAIVLAGRTLVSHLVSGIAAHGPSIAGSLIVNVFRGAIAGREHYAAIPEAALRFYSDPGVLPDFGQVPLSRKLIARLRRARRRSDPK